MSYLHLFLTLLLLSLALSEKVPNNLFTDRRPYSPDGDTPKDCWGVHLNCCDLINVNVTALLSASGWGGKEAGPLGVALGQEEDKNKNCLFKVEQAGIEGIGLDTKVKFRLTSLSSWDPFGKGYLTMSYRRPSPSSPDIIQVISGFIWSSLGAFEFTPLCDAQNGCYHLLTEVDTNSLPDEVDTNDMEQNRMLNPEEDFEYIPQKRSDAGIQDITVSAYYTKEFKNVTSNPEEFIENAFGDATLSFLASEVPARLKVRCIEEASSLEEDNNSINMILAFQKLKGTVSKLRKSSDIGILFTSTMSSCGIAYTNGFTDGYTIGVVSKPCAVPNFSLAHELAHMFGAAHERERGVRSGNDYGYGYFIDDEDGNPSGYRTAMAYSRLGYRRRIGWFSNPNIVIANLTLGAEDSEDTARLLRDNLADMAAVGDEQEQC